MTTEQGLLAAIWESPHDDLLRLVYADWLDETGDPTQSPFSSELRPRCGCPNLLRQRPPRQVIRNCPLSLAW